MIFHDFYDFMLLVDFSRIPQILLEYSFVAIKNHKSIIAILPLEKFTTFCCFCFMHRLITREFFMEFLWFYEWWLSENVLQAFWLI